MITKLLLCHKSYYITINCYVKFKVVYYLHYIFYFTISSNINHIPFIKNCTSWCQHFLFNFNNVHRKADKDQGETVNACFLDFKSVLETVDKNILIESI